MTTGCHAPRCGCQATVGCWGEGIGRGDARVRGDWSILALDGVGCRGGGRGSWDSVGKPSITGAWHGDGVGVQVVSSFRGPRGLILPRTRPASAARNTGPVFLRCANQVEPLKSRDAAGERTEASEAEVAEMSKEVLMSRRPAAMDTIDATRCV